MEEKKQIKYEWVERYMILKKQNWLNFPIFILDARELEFISLLFPWNHWQYSSIRKVVECIDLMKGGGSMQNFAVQE